MAVGDDFVEFAAGKAATEGDVSEIAAEITGLATSRILYSL